MFTNKNVFILGMARSGYDAARVLAKMDNKVLLNDQNENQDLNHIEELEYLGVKIVLGKYDISMLDGIDYVVKNPGINDKHELIQIAKERGIPVINEVELAYSLLPKDVTLIGITGTNGKTTTTTLTYEILNKAFGDRVHLAGNIGFPLCSILNKLKPNDIIVMEVSCQQSVNFINFHPHIGLITNFSEAHLDFFNSYREYKMSKAKMLYNQESTDIAILNKDNEEVLETTKDIKSIKKYFSKDNIKNNYIHYNGEIILDIDKIKIPGIHNLENIMAAISIAKEFDVPNEIICDAVYNFTGVKHRLEYIDTVNGIKYYNDTEATNIKCTQIALSSFDKPTILILGGKERNQDFDDLKPFMKNVKAIIGIGECRERVRDFGSKLNINTYIHEYLKDGFKRIKDIAETGDIVLLSPASASWDQYKECEVRGDEFRDLVFDLKNNGGNNEQN